MTRKFKPVNEAPTRVAGAHLPPHLFAYVKGLAEIRNQSLSAVLVSMVEEHLAKNIKTGKRSLT